MIWTKAQYKIYSGCGLTHNKTKPTNTEKNEQQSH